MFTNLEPPRNPHKLTMTTPTSKLDPFGFWMTTGQPTTSFVHLAWRAQSEQQVDLFYYEALSHGSQCNGKPGPREYKPANYYSAYVFDPDGNNIELVFGNE
jgi:catechol 2,3-dioxygenase-like lactoylglutathione lyase family enzyme